MATFRFRLASILRYRERVKEEKRLELKALYEEKERLESEIRRLVELFLRQVQELEGQKGRILTAADLKLQGDYSQRIVESIKTKHRLLAEAAKRVEAKRGEVIQADRGAKSLVQLREKSWQRYRREEMKREQGLIDESGQRRYLNRK